MKEGDCFEANANELLDLFFKHKGVPFKLCHGEVMKSYK